MPKRVADTPVRTLVDRDLELPIRLLSTDLDRPILKPQYDFVATRYTEVSKPSYCYVCNREHQAQRRATIRNATLGEEFHSGLVCLEKHFDVRSSDLEKKSIRLKQLARAWEAYRTTVGPDFEGFQGTKEAVEDMYGKIRTIPTMGQVESVLSRILDNLAEVQRGALDDEIAALQDLLGLIYEFDCAPTVIELRLQALAQHPLLEDSQRALASRVLGNQKEIIWDDLLTLSRALKAIRRKKVKLQVRQAPAFRFSGEQEYHQGLEERARQIRDSIDRRHEFTPAHLFNRVLRESAQELVKKCGGLRTFAFESKSARELEALEPNFEVTAILKNADVRYLPSYGIQPYEGTTVRTERTSVRGMLRESQLEEDEPEGGRKSWPRKGFFRSVVVYLPDPYLPCYQIWARNGGIDEARARLENLTSSLPT